MFGMSSKEFWEDDPQLYWAYRIFYLKKMEDEQKEKIELLKYEAWLNGYATFNATSVSLNNSFSKEAISYPTYQEMFMANEETKKLSNKDKNIIAQQEFNSWARL